MYTFNGLLSPDYERMVQRLNGGGLLDGPPVRTKDGWMGAPPQAQPTPELSQGIDVSQLPAIQDQQQQPGLLGRTQAAMSNLVTPAGYPSSLLQAAGVSQQEVDQSRPGLINYLFSGKGTPSRDEQHADALDRLVKRKLLGQEAERGAALMAQRAQISQSLGPIPQDEAGFDSFMRRAYASYIKSGDMERVKDLNAVMQQITSGQTKPMQYHATSEGLYMTDPTGKNPPQLVVPSKGHQDKYEMPDGSIAYYGPGNPPPPNARPVQNDNTLVPVQQPGGQVTYVPRGQAAGGLVPGKGSLNLPAPLAAKVGQFGEMLKKADDLFPAMEALNVKLASSAAQDIAAHGIGVAGHAIPGSRGLGSMMLNRSPEYAKYQAALSPLVLAAAHAISGARISNEQVAQIRESIEIKPGDQPPIVAQKVKNVVDLINSIGGSLPADAIMFQESQLTPEQLQRVQGYGYQLRQPDQSRTPQAAPGGLSAAAAEYMRTHPPQGRKP